MSDAWEEIQAVKSKRNELRERLQKRRKEREDLLGGGDSSSVVKTETNVKISGNPRSFKTNYVYFINPI